MTENAPPPASQPDDRLSRWGWPALVVVLALLAVRGVFSLSEIFYVRDLTSYYWPQHLWLRSTLLAGDLPLWDPHLAYGQPAIADPIRHILFLPTLPLRVFLPDVVGFNLSVALPMPAAALGAYLFFNRHASRPAAALGAVVFALSGAVLSTGNMINHSSAVALVPWVLWAVDRLGDRMTTRRLAVLALAIGLQALAGEGVTLACTGALAVLYALLGHPGALDGRRRAALAGLTAVAGLAGALLAAVQLWPMLSVLERSTRGLGDAGDGWSLHPLTLVEAVAPSFYGETLLAMRYWSHWVNPFNSGREPYLTSIYVGVAALLVAVLGAAAGSTRRWRLFWVATLAVSLLLAFGYNTPVYGLLRENVPLVDTFRYPAKYALFATLALSATAATGWDWLARRGEAGGTSRARLVAVAAGLFLAAVGGVAALLALLAPEALAGGFARLAGAVGIDRVEQAAEFAVGSTAVHGPRLLGLAAVTVATLWLASSSRPLAAVARNGLFALVVCDLLLTNLDLNPTMSAALLRAPAWVAATREHPTDRVYVGRGERSMDDEAIDAPPMVGVAPETPARAVGALRAVLFTTMPSGWGVRESISRDLTRLRSVDYWLMSDGFHSFAGGSGRGRYLARTATRYYLLSSEPGGDFRLAMEMPELSPLALYELTTPFPRAFVSRRATVEPKLAVHTIAMMSPELDPHAEVLVTEEPPPPAGAPGPGLEPGAEVVEEWMSELTVRARAPDGGGFLVLNDAYDPDWRVEVDGAEAPLLKANGLFRAVHLAPGEHTLRLAYRPASFYGGLAVSLATALSLLGLSLRPLRLVPERGAAAPAAAEGAPPAGHD